MLEEKEGKEKKAVELRRMEIIPWERERETKKEKRIQIQVY